MDCGPTVAVCSSRDVSSNTRYSLPVCLSVNASLKAARTEGLCRDGEVRVASRGQEIVSVASRGVCFMCISCVPRCLLHVYQLRPELSASCVSVASRGVCFTCISCVPRCLLHVYQLSPEVFASRVSVASRGVCFTCVSCVPSCQPQTWRDASRGY